MNKEEALTIYVKYLERRIEILERKVDVIVDGVAPLIHGIDKLYNYGNSRMQMNQLRSDQQQIQHTLEKFPEKFPEEFKDLVDQNLVPEFWLEKLYE